MRLKVNVNWLWVWWSRSRILSNWSWLIQSGNTQKLIFFFSRTLTVIFVSDVCYLTQKWMQHFDCNTTSLTVSSCRFAVSDGGDTRLTKETKCGQWTEGTCTGQRDWQEQTHGSCTLAWENRGRATHSLVSWDVWLWLWCSEIKLSPCTVVERPLCQSVSRDSMISVREMQTDINWFSPLNLLPWCVTRTQAHEIFSYFWSGFRAITTPLR